MSLLAAGLKHDDQPRALEGGGRLAVLIPAHNEASGIGRTLDSVMASDLPARCRSVVVIADNCTDETASAARAAGVEVWERFDDQRRGKGHALAWALARLIDDPSVTGICVLDADCEISANALSSIVRRLKGGTELVQLPYTVSNPEQSRQAALRWAGFALFNVIRPRGRDRLGLSCGLLGTGMGVSTALLRRSPWRAFSFAEDREQHMRWVLDGARAVFATEAGVISPAVGARTAADGQEARWDSGRAHLAVAITPRLLVRGLRRRDPCALDAALEPLMLPQSLLVGVSGLALVTALASRSPRSARLAVASLVGQAVYVVGGLRAAGAPPDVWRALRHAPRFVVRRVGVSLQLVGPGRPGEWQRTARESSSAVP